MKLLVIWLVGIVACAHAAFETCDRKFSKIGCYQRDVNLFPDALLTGRYVTEKYMPKSGLINWKQFNDYIHGLTCECAEKAKKLNYPYFAIGFYGECYGGKDRIQIATSIATTATSDKCVRGDYGKCGSASDGKHECVGKAHHEYIYALQQFSSDDNSKVDGGYGEWSDWGGCTETCGEGVQFRERSCNNPMPVGNGKNCEELGESTESRSCTLKECPVDGVYTKWSEYTQCTASCGGGTMTRSRTCTNPPPAHGGAECDGPSEESKSCGTDHCPIDGKYGNWSNYSVCSVTCGGGTQHRDRKCDSPAPKHGGEACQGLDEEYQSCNNQECPVDGSWTTWSGFSVCDKECGYGLQKRSRSCSNPAPMHGGKACQGDDVNTRRCIKVECPVNGKWTQWTSYSACSKTCNVGKQTRSRTCTNPAPLHNGQPCSGRSSETVDCNKGVRCPYYTDYGTYTACEGANLRIWCTDPVQKIVLSEYWYGRQNTNTCSGILSFAWSTSCKLSSPSKIYNECEGKTTCTIKSNNGWMGSDPCIFTPKYVYVKFRCYG